MPDRCPVTPPGGGGQCVRLPGHAGPHTPADSVVKPPPSNNPYGRSFTLSSDDFNDDLCREWVGDRLEPTWTNQIKHVCGRCGWESYPQPGGGRPSLGGWAGWAVAGAVLGVCIVVPTTAFLFALFGYPEPGTPAMTVAFLEAALGGAAGGCFCAWAMSRGLYCQSFHSDPVLTAHLSKTSSSPPSDSV